MVSMSATIGYRSPLEAAVSLFAASLVAGLAATMVGTADGTAPPARSSALLQALSPQSSAAQMAAGQGPIRIALLFGDDIATATLADTPAAHEFAATLPVTIDLQDRFGQAKIGELPHDLTAGDDVAVSDPVAGGIYFWSPDGTIAVLTSDLGPSVPAPGLIPLGAVDTGLNALSAAGNHVQVTIRPAA
jgi:hypothetical protein